MPLFLTNNVVRKTIIPPNAIMITIARRATKLLFLIIFHLEEKDACYSCIGLKLHIVSVEIPERYIIYYSTLE